MKTRKSQARRSADQTGLFRYTLFRCWPWMLGAVSISSVLILILASQPIVLDLFFKRLEAAFSPDASFIALLGLTLLLILANPIWNSFNTYFWQNYRRKMQIVLEGIFAKQIASYRAECFEDTAFLNRLEQAQQGLKGYISMWMAWSRMSGLTSSIFVLRCSFTVARAQSSCCCPFSCSSQPCWPRP